MPTTDRDINLLTELALRLREETYGAGKWDRIGTHAVISEFKHHDLAITLDRVRGHAADKEARTPGAMRRAFIPAGPAGTSRQPAKAGNDCRYHPGQPVINCPLCAVDHISHPEDPGPSTDTDAGRALLEEIRKRREGGDPA